MNRPLRLLVAVALLATPGGLAVASSSAAPGLKLTVLSGRADMVTGGDALVEVVVPAGTGTKGLAVQLAGRDVSRAFSRGADGRVTGLITGARLGASTLTARLPRTRSAQLVLTNHPIGGPVFSGKQVQPWICATEASGLGAPSDRQCNAATVVTYRYKSTSPAANGFQAYDPAKPAADVATTTTDQGKTVPYIVRNERGTLNRSIYDIAILWDPTKTAAKQPAWNHKLGYTFGGGCAPNHRQTNNSAAVLDDIYLKRGMAVASAGLNVLGNNCNEVVSAETVMMVKERIVEQYGQIRYTIGNGCSGGSIQQNVIANAYPGLLNGIQPACTYPDSWTTGVEVYDCTLLLRYFDAHPTLTPAQRGAVVGQQSEAPCRAWHDTFAFDRTTGDPSIGCDGLILGPQLLAGYASSAYVYNAKTNPKGARCTKQDYEAAVVGLRPDGKAKNGYDNIGVPYGMRALQTGAITPGQFVDLNEKVGAFDIDFVPTKTRLAADPGVLEVLARSGRVNDARQLDDVPIIDLRGADNYEIHTDYNSYVLRERLKKANGHADNYVMFTAMTPLVVPPSVTEEALVLMDQWLASIESDRTASSTAQKVRTHKPAGAVDACYVGTKKVTDATVCRTALPYFASPRIAAGAPFTNVAAKCQLKPLTRSAFTVAFSDAEWKRLGAALPSGLCDYRLPAVGEGIASQTWTTFTAGPGGVRLGAAPVSTAGR